MSWSDSARVLVDDAADEVRKILGVAPAPFRLLTALQLGAPLRRAIGRGRQALLALQDHAGEFPGRELGTAPRQSSLILLYAYLGRLDSGRMRAAARRLIELQRADGGWSRAAGCPFDLSTSVLAYWALKLSGHAATSEPVACARRAILSHGGVSGTDAAVRAWLALFGQIPYHTAIGPGFSRSSAADCGRAAGDDDSPLADRARLARSIVAVERPRRYLRPELGIRELFLSRPDAWPAANDASTQRRWPSRFQTILTHLIRRAFRIRDDRPARRPTRAALGAARRQLLARIAGRQSVQDEGGADGNEDPSGADWDEVVWSIVALEALGYTDDTPPRRAAAQCLEAMLHLGDDVLHVRSSARPRPDTATAVIALVESGLSADHAAIHGAVGRLLSCPEETTAAMARRLSALILASTDRSLANGNVLPPELQLCSDEEDARALDIARADATAAHVDRAVQRLLEMQQRDAGWSGQGRGAGRGPSEIVATALALAALAQAGDRVPQHRLARAATWLREHQQADGSWHGNAAADVDAATGAIEATSRVLIALAAAGLAADDDVVAAGVQWLLAHQQPGGGWGELPPGREGYLAGEGPPTVQQTALAVLALLAVNGGRDEAAGRGMEFLLAIQQPDGTWNPPTEHHEQADVADFGSTPRGIAEPLVALSRWASQASVVRGHESPRLKIAECSG